MKSWRHPFAALLITGFFCTAVTAQRQPESELARLFHVDVKTGMQVQFEAGLKAHIQWRHQQGDPWQWNVFQIVNGEWLGDYVIRSGSHTWADLDAYDEFLSKAAAHFYASVGAYVNSVSGYITRTDSSISRWPEDPGSVRYLQVIDYFLKPERAGQFLEVAKQVHEAIGTSGWPVHYAWEINVNGGRGSVLTLVLPYENYAAMEGPEKEMDAMLTEVYGEAKAGELFQGLQSSIEHTETHLAKARPDLAPSR